MALFRPVLFVRAPSRSRHDHHSRTARIAAVRASLDKLTKLIAVRATPAAHWSCWPTSRTFTVTSSLASSTRNAPFTMGTRLPNNALWTDNDPVTLFAARGLCESGTERVTETFDRVTLRISVVRDYASLPLRLRDQRRLRVHSRHRALRGIAPRRAARPAGTSRHPCLPSGAGAMAQRSTAMPTGSSSTPSRTHDPRTGGTSALTPRPQLGR